MSGEVGTCLGLLSLLGLGQFDPGLDWFLGGFSLDTLPLPLRDPLRLLDKVKREGDRALVKVKSKQRRSRCA